MKYEFDPLGHTEVYLERRESEAAKAALRRGAHAARRVKPLATEVPYGSTSLFTRTLVLLKGIFRHTSLHSPNRHLDRPHAADR